MFSDKYNDNIAQIYTIDLFIIHVMLMYNVILSLFNIYYLLNVLLILFINRTY